MNQPSNRSSIILMTIGSFFAFFTFGAIDVLKGSTLSAVLEDMQYNYSRGGFIVMAAYFGFVVASLATGVIADRVGKKAIVILAALFFLVGIYSYAASHSVALFVLAFFLIGFACGSAELGANYIIIEVQPRSPGLYLNLLTACFGLGCMLAPIYTGIMFRSGLTWREVYLYSLPFPLLLLVFFLIAPYPKLAASAPSSPDFRELFRTAFTPTMCWVYVLNFSYVATEVCIGTWLVEYLKVLHATPIDSGSTWLAVYFGCIMAGRLAGGFFVDRVGYLRSIAIAIVAAFLCIVIGISGASALVILLPLSGLFLSIILPTATAFVSTMGIANLGSILGIFFAFVGLGGMAGPWIAGRVNDWFGLRAGVGTAAFFCLVMLVSLIHIRKLASQNRGAEA